MVNEPAVDGIEPGPDDWVEPQPDAQQDPGEEGDGGGESGCGCIVAI